MCSTEIDGVSSTTTSNACTGPEDTEPPGSPVTVRPAASHGIGTSHSFNDLPSVASAANVAATPPSPSPRSECRCGAAHRSNSPSGLLSPSKRNTVPNPRPRTRTRTMEMVADHLSIQHLLENNRLWREKKKSNDATFFERMADKQTPRYLWIGCSDSRVPAEEVTGIAPGEMFVHRNIANLVVSNDISSLSVIQFAVEKLKVRDIIVCGHYGCGGVLAAMENKTLGLLDNWLRNIRDVCRLYQPELVAIATDKERFRRIVELNIIEQCLNIFKINMVQRHQLKYGFPRIHGLVYDIRSGELKELDIDFHGYLRNFLGIYRLHSFPTDDIPMSRCQLRVSMVRHLIDGHEEDEGRVSVRYITRALKAEKELFSAQEVDDAIEWAKQRLDDDDAWSPFIAVADLIRYFDEDADNYDDDEVGGRGGGDGEASTGTAAATAEQGVTVDAIQVHLAQL